MTSMCEMVGQLIQKKQEEKQIQEDQAANALYWKIPAYYDDDDDYNFAITPNEPIDSLSMRDEHLDTISAMESDEFIKSSVENLVPNPSESKGENGCDMPACFTTFSNILFDAEYEFDSVNNQLLHNENFPEEIFLNPLFEEEINSMRIGQHHLNVESDLIGSLLNHDSSIIPSYSKIDSLLDEFAEPLYGLSPCRWCTCEQCGVDLRDGICPLCNSMNSCTYDPNLNSFDYPPDSYHPPHPTYETYSGDSCGNDSQFGYDCPPQFPLNYEPEPGYTQNYNSCPHDSPSFPQQYPCCDDCGVTHEPYHFDQIQTPQYTVNHPIFIAHNDFLNSQNELFTYQNKIMEQMTQLTSMCEMTCQIVQKKLEEKQIEEEQAAKAQNRKLPVCYDDDDDEEESNYLKDNNISELPPCSAVTPNETVNSLSMGDEHLDTISATELDEVIKSSVEDLVPIPSESEGENGCDV
nr:hypothetical protein [Tanacetum cinerariifolium]